MLESIYVSVCVSSLLFMIEKMRRAKMVNKAITGYKLAVLHQGAAAPAVGGVTKPFKPGGGQVFHNKCS